MRKFKWEYEHLYANGKHYGGCGYLYSYAEFKAGFCNEKIYEMTDTFIRLLKYV